MVGEVRLRAVSAEDVEFLEKVYVSTRMAELSVTDWTDAQKAQFCHAQFIAQDTYYREHYLGAQFSIVEHGGRPVGRLYVARWEKEIRIIDIAFLPEHRRQGLASKLLLGLQAEAAATARTLSIHVEVFNPARNLYDRLGFRLREDKGVYLLLEWRPPEESFAS